MEDNLFVVEYCIENSNWRRQELVIIAVNFEKSLDPVDRRAIIKAMKKYKSDPLVIEVMAKIYVKDCTDIYLEVKKM